MSGITRKGGLIAAVLVLAVACRGDDATDGGADAGGDAGSDGGGDAGGDGGGDGGGGDGSADAGPLSCGEMAIDEGAFPVAFGLPDTQLHPMAVFDGEAVWVAFNLPEGSAGSGFDVWAVRVACDRTRLGEPFQMDTTTAPNELGPSMAVGADRILGVWQADTSFISDEQPNLKVYYRLFGFDGTPLTDLDQQLLMTRGGEPLGTNAWSTVAAALPGGAFAIAGTRGIPDAPGFQTFVQLLDADGNLDGEAVDGFVDADVTHTDPAIAAAGDGTLYVAWTDWFSDDGTETKSVVLKVVDDGSAEPESVAPEADLSEWPVMAVGGDDDSEVYLAFHVFDGSFSTIRVMDAAAPASSRPSLDLGGASQVNWVPAIATGPGGGAVAWFRNVTGMENDVVVQGFSRDGETLSPGVETVIPTTGSAPQIYGIGFTHVVDDVYFVVWAEGDNPDFRLMARFIRVG